MPKTRKEYIVSVTGKRPFPIDMLRYESAVPASEADAHVIEDTFGPQYPPQEMTLRVRMMRPPTDSRWQSFAWPVTNIEERTQNA